MRYFTDAAAPGMTGIRTGSTRMIPGEMGAAMEALTRLQQPRSFRDDAPPVITLAEGAFAVQEEGDKLVIYYVAGLDEAVQITSLPASKFSAENTGKAWVIKATPSMPDAKPSSATTDSASRMAHYRQINAGLRDHLAARNARARAHYAGRGY